jgi:predicted TPR repeat methyltransferase
MPSLKKAILNYLSVLEMTMVTCPHHIAPGGVVGFSLKKGEGDGQETLRT